MGPDFAVLMLVRSLPTTLVYVKLSKKEYLQVHQFKTADALAA